LRRKIANIAPATIIRANAIKAPSPAAKILGYSSNAVDVRAEMSREGGFAEAGS
jgi:hypothetical protein